MLSYKAFVLILKEKQKRLYKLKLRAKIRILIGFKGYKIYRVYVLLRCYNKIVCLLNVRFNKEDSLITSTLNDYNTNNLIGIP